MDDLNVKVFQQLDGSRRCKVKDCARLAVYEINKSEMCHECGQRRVKAFMTIYEE